MWLSCLMERIQAVFLRILRTIFVNVRCYVIYSLKALQFTWCLIYMLKVW